MSRTSLFWLRSLAAALVVLFCLPALAGLGYSGDTGVRYWQVERGDTLFAIGRALAPGDIVRQRQVRAELLRRNPTAFEDGDPGRLIVGRRLEIPGSGTAAARSVPPARTASVRTPPVGTPPERPTAVRTAASAAARSSSPVEALPQSKPASQPSFRPPALQKVSTSVATPPPKLERAGHVVASRGVAVAIGVDGKRRTLVRRAALYHEDELVTGPNSYLQFRTRDGAFLSLRPETRFKIEKYRYDGQGDSDAKAFFRLVQGGLRTITGVIGKYNRKAYRLRTPVATIGIRGTHFAVRLCGAGDCAKATAEGASKILPSGLYGSVVEGAIAVFNEAGKELAGTGQFFHVADAAAAPQLLPESPGIVFTPEQRPMTGKERGETKRLPSSGLERVQKDAIPADKSVGPIAGTRVPESVALNEPVFTAGETLQGEILTDPEKLPELFRPQRPLSVSEPDYEPEPAPDGAVVITRFIEDLGGTYRPHGGTVRADGTAANEILLDEVNGADNSVVAWSGDDPGFFGGRCTTCGFDADNANLKDVGGIAGPGIGINWGRWKGGYVVTEGGNALATTGDLFFVYSPNISSDSAIAAQAGTATFNYAGGPPPRDEMGRAGEVLSASVGVDFSAQTVESYDLSLKTPDGVGGWRNWNASLSGPPVSFSEALNSDNLNLTGSCPECATTGVSGKASLQFVGSDVSHGISGYGLKDSSQQNAAAGVMVLQR